MGDNTAETPAVHAEPADNCQDLQAVLAGMKDTELEVMQAMIDSMRSDRKRLRAAWDAIYEVSSHLDPGCDTCRRIMPLIEHGAALADTTYKV